MFDRKTLRCLLALAVAASIGGFAYAETGSAPVTPVAPITVAKPVPTLYTDQAIGGTGDRIEIAKVDLSSLTTPGSTAQVAAHEKDAKIATARLVDQALQTNGLPEAYKGFSTEDQVRIAKAVQHRDTITDKTIAAETTERTASRHTAIEAQLTRLRASYKTKYNEDLHFTDADFAASTTYLEAKIDDPAKFQRWPVRAIFPEGGKPTGMTVNDKNRTEPKALVGADGSVPTDIVKPAVTPNPADVRAAEPILAREPGSAHSTLKAGDMIGLLKLNGDAVSPTVVVSMILQDGVVHLVLPQASKAEQVELNLNHQFQALNDSKIWSLDAAGAKRIIAKNVLMAFYDDGTTTAPRVAEVSTSGK